MRKKAKERELESEKRSILRKKIELTMVIYLIMPWISIAATFLFFHFIKSNSDTSHTYNSNFPLLWIVISVIVLAIALIFAWDKSGLTDGFIQRLTAEDRMRTFLKIFIPMTILEILAIVDSIIAYVFVDTLRFISVILGFSIVIGNLGISTIKELGLDRVKPRHARKGDVYNE
jgi:hypothetical protein